jgi:hypothetical protein
MKTKDLSEAPLKELFILYANILNELRRRGITRSTNNPAADYAEHLVSTALGLEVVGKSNAGYDAVDSKDQRYQIKSRRITSHNSSRQLSFIRGLEAGRRPFDYLAGVLLKEDFSILRACVIPFEIVKQHSKHVPHVNGWRFVLHDKIWALPDVEDITDALRERV